MKRLFIINTCAVGLLLCGVADAQKKKKGKRKNDKKEKREDKREEKKVVKPVEKKMSLPTSEEMESLIFSKDLWKTKIVDFEKNPLNKKFKFKWQTSTKRGLRSEGVGFKMFGANVGEIVIISNAGEELKGISLSFYNKGDDQQMASAKFEALANDLASKISQKLSTKPRTDEKKSVVRIKRSVWTSEGTSYSLEKSVSLSGQPEFLRYRVMSARTANRGESTANRASLRANVVRDKKTGGVYIENVPMVDQGKKGYCACASAARIYQYYGRTTDQHEIAQIAGSSASRGTTIPEMVGALKKVTSQLNSRVNILYEYPKGLSDPDLDYRTYESGMKDMMRDINSYQMMAKKEGAKSIPIKGRKPYSRLSSKETLSFSLFTSACDPKIYREVMIKKSSYSRFKSKIKEYIDQGVPIGWCLQLGLFPEKGLPQARGGHMRLIIGYNDKTKEIIYTDSWGAGHAKKVMDTGEAFSMTNVLLVLPPTK